MYMVIYSHLFTKRSFSAPTLRSDKLLFRLLEWLFFISDKLILSCINHLALFNNMSTFFRFFFIFINMTY